MRAALRPEEEPRDQIQTRSPVSQPLGVVRLQGVVVRATTSSANSRRVPGDVFEVIAARFSTATTTAALSAPRAEPDTQAVVPQPRWRRPWRRSPADSNSRRQRSARMSPFIRVHQCTTDSSIAGFRAGATAASADLPTPRRRASRSGQALSVGAVDTDPGGHRHQPDQQGVGHRAGRTSARPGMSRPADSVRTHAEADVEAGRLRLELVDGGIGHS